MKRWSHAILPTLLLLLTACGEPADRILRMGLASAPLNLDPRYTVDATAERINRLLYQRLIEFDARSMPTPGIADWQRLTSRHYRIRLNARAGPFMHGRRVDADDVIATYRYVLDPDKVSPRRTTLTLIESISKVDALTVDFHLSRTDPLFPAYLTLDILPADLLAKSHDFARLPVGSGPFVLHAWPEPGKLLLQRRNDRQLIELLEVKNPTVRVLKLLRGEIDLLQNDLSPELIGYLASKSSIELQRRFGSNYTYIGFNLQDPHTGDPRVRRAIAHAIDRQAIIDRVMAGAARRAEALFPPEHWLGSGQLTAHGYDPATARRLLSEAGFGAGNPLRLVYKTSSDPYRIRLATIIQSQLKAVGIEVDLRSYDWGTLFGDIKAGNFQLYSLSWVGLRTPDSFRYIFASDSLPPMGANRGRYANSLVDDLLRRAEAAGALPKQAVLYQRIQQQLHEDLPYVSLWYEGQVSAQGERVRGYRLMADGNYDGLAQVSLYQTEEPQDARSAVAH
ncbi:MAG: ABC transporter substrate-binding protein [Candidatus Thiodiazotropha sp. (ex Epidulcina cf. delphinae)]|nr:ABC transporter substrate-binding protein [Candidatus Thiodiazotropha sp. (ex Epidulcina cf. delphinae)]